MCRLPRLYQNQSIARHEGLVSLLSAPLVFGGQAIGTLNVYTGAPRSFSNEEVHILRALAELSAIAIEKARLYERIVDVEEQLRQNEKFSALGLLAAEVAHEIRNPLTVMKMLYHSLGLEFKPGDPRIKDDAILREKMDHLNKIVEQILDFARGTEPNLGAVNINQLLEDLGLLTRHKLRNHRIQFVRQLAPSLPAVMADVAAHLAQAFLNLTLNAVEAMPAGGTLTITTRAFRLPRDSARPTHILIEFKDTGQGMPEEQRRRAFTSCSSTTPNIRERGWVWPLSVASSKPTAAKSKSAPAPATAPSSASPCPCNRKNSERETWQKIVERFQKLFVCRSREVTCDWRR